MFPCEMARCIAAPLPQSKDFRRLFAPIRSFEAGPVSLGTEVLTGPTLSIAERSAGMALPVRHAAALPGVVAEVPFLAVAPADGPSRAAEPVDVPSGVGPAVAAVAPCEVVVEPSGAAVAPAVQLAPAAAAARHVAAEPAAAAVQPVGAAQAVEFAAEFVIEAQPGA